MVETDVVVWEVTDSVYTSSSLLSSVNKLSGTSLEEVFLDNSSEVSCLEVSLGGVGFVWEGEGPFPVCAWGA